MTAGYLFFFLMTLLDYLSVASRSTECPRPLKSFFNFRFRNWVSQSYPLLKTCLHYLFIKLISFLPSQPLSKQRKVEEHTEHYSTPAAPDTAQELCKPGTEIAAVSFPHSSQVLKHFSFINFTSLIIQAQTHFISIHTHFLDISSVMILFRLLKFWDAPLGITRLHERGAGCALPTVTRLYTFPAFASRGTKG